MVTLRLLTVLSLILFIDPVCSNIFDDIVNTVTGLFSSGSSPPPTQNDNTERPDGYNYNPSDPQLS